MAQPGSQELRIRRGKWRYKPNHKSMRSFLLSDELRGLVVPVGHLIAADAAATATKKTGDLASGYKVDSSKRAGTMKVQGNTRVKIVVYNKDSAAAPEEFGGKRNKAKHTLRNAAARHGRLAHNGESV